MKKTKVIQVEVMQVYEGNSRVHIEENVILSSEENNAGIHNNDFKNSTVQEIKSTMPYS